LIPYTTIFKPTELPGLLLALQDLDLGSEHRMRHDSVKISPAALSLSNKVFSSI
jgi:hypothetical protein